jgi:flagellar basal-body rod protein FlgC
MNLFGMLAVSGSALTAERQRAEVVTSNMANMETTRTPEGGPYRRQLVVFRSRRMPQFPALLAGFGNVSARGVRVDQVIADAKPPLERFQPGHPDADAKGYVSYPAVDPVEETADLMGAVRAYELNASAVQSTKTMIQQSLDLLR